MWYFSWMLGIGFAILLAILNAMWGEHEAARRQARLSAHDPDDREDDAEAN